jgi:hypothetical protein
MSVNDTKTEEEQDEDFDTYVTIIVILAAMFLGYKNKAKIRKKITDLLASFK